MNIQELIETVKALDAKATKGPWKRDRSRDGRQNQSIGQEYMDCVMDNGQRISSNHVVAWKQGGRSAIPDADFIAQSRSLLPLCARLLEVYERHTRDRLAEWPFPELHAELDAALSDAKEQG